MILNAVHHYGRGRDITKGLGNRMLRYLRGGSAGRKQMKRLQKELEVKPRGASDVTWKKLEYIFYVVGMP